MGTQRELLEHAPPDLGDSLLVAQGHLAERLNVQMLRLADIDVREGHILALYGEGAVG